MTGAGVSNQGGKKIKISRLTVDGLDTAIELGTRAMEILDRTDRVALLMLFRKSQRAIEHVIHLRNETIDDRARSSGQIARHVLRAINEMQEDCEVLILAAEEFERWKSEGGKE